MYEQPTIADNVLIEGVSTGATLEDSNVDSADTYSQEAVKSKKEEDNQYTLKENKLILRWGLVFTFFR